MQKELTLQDMRLEGSVELRGETSTPSRSMKVKLSCRSDEPVSRSFGSLVHSLEGINRSKDRYPLTYMHSEVSIGYCNHFRIENGNLIADGVLINNNDKAEEIMTNLRDGVPYEVSIVTDNMSVLEIEEDETFEANGKTYEGPVYIALTSRLRAVGIVDMGADQNTECVKLNLDETQVVDVINKEELMSTDAEVQKTVDDSNIVTETENEENVTEETQVELSAETEAEVNTETETEEPAPAQDVEEEVEAEDEVEAETPVTDAREEFKALVDMFGAERAAKYFADGVSLSDAKDNHYQELIEENKKLKVALSATGGTEAVTPSVDNVDQVTLAKENSFRSRVGNSSVAKLAARVKLPK